MLTRLCSLPFNVLSNCQLAKVENTLITTVRWRKRRWAPITPSKLFSIPERRPENAEESAELKVRYAHYRTQMRSLRYWIWVLSEDYIPVAVLLSNKSCRMMDAYIIQCLSANRANDNGVLWLVEGSGVARVGVTRGGNNRAPTPFFDLLKLKMFATFSLLQKKISFI